MKKLTTLIILALSFFVLARTASAQGTYRCQYGGGLCYFLNVNCDEGFGPASDNYCSDHNGNQTACESQDPRACVNQNPGVKYKCTGAGLCTACAANESCPFDTLSDCENDTSCQTTVPGGGPGQAATFAGFCNGQKGIKTAIGCIPFGSPSEITSFFIKWGIGIGGGITILLLVYGGFLVMTSQGDPKRLQAGRELVTSAISGVILIIFSIFILRLLGVQILGLF